MPAQTTRRAAAYTAVYAEHPRPPKPTWQGLFREPEYPDGPYAREDEDPDEAP